MIASTFRMDSWGSDTPAKDESEEASASLRGIQEIEQSSSPFTVAFLLGVSGEDD